MINQLRTIGLTILLFFNVFLTNGCWNYREIDKLALVAGFALDKDDDRYDLNTEIISYESQGMETKAVSKIVESKGKTLFDAVRNVILVSGKRLYWSHAKVIIIGQSVAKQDLAKSLDLIYRDAEMRLDINPIISKEKTAKEIFTLESPNMPIRSFEISQMIKSENSLSKALDVEFYQFINSIAGKNAPAILPTIGSETHDGKKGLKIKGTAVLKKDKLVGFLDTEETKYLLFAINKVKAGLLVENEKNNGEQANITLEIFKSHTETKPDIHNGKIKMKINIRVEASIGELETPIDYIDAPKREELTRDAEKALEKSVRRVIRKVQKDYDSDVFGFYSIIRNSNPSLWKKVEPNWDDIFRTLDVNVKARILIKNSAMASKPIKIGE